MRFIRENKLLILSILAISWPAIAEMALNTLVGVADTIMIGWFVNSDAINSVGNANQIMFTIIFVFSSFNVGATALISRSNGEKNYHRLGKVVGQNLSLNIVIGLIITVFTILSGSHILKLFKTTTEVYDMGVSYINIVSFSQIFMFICFAAAASLRGVGDTKTPMVITGIVNLLNIVGNYVLIKGVWIFPKMGVDGAALSTTISRIIGSVLYLFVLIRGNEYLKVSLSNMKLTRDVIKPLWNLSITAGLEQLLMHTSFFVMGIIVSVLDTSAESAFRIILTIESTSFMPAIGFSIAAATLVGKSLGEKDKTKALKTGYISSSLGVLWGISIGAVFAIFPALIAGIFTNNPLVINELVFPIIIAGIDQPLLGFSIIIAGSLRGAGDTKTVMILTALRLWLFFVPLTYFLIVHRGYGIVSIYFAEMITLIVFNLLMLKRFKDGKWADIKV